MSIHRGTTLLVVALGLFSGITSASADVSWPVDGSQLAFSARLKGKPAGSLSYDFTQGAEGLVEHRVEHLEFTKLLVKAAIDQTTISTWHGQTLEAIAATTSLKSSLKDADFSFKGHRSANGVLAVLDSEGKNHEIPADAWPLSLPRRTTASHTRFFDLSKGEAIAVQSKSAGMETVEADGGSLICERVEAKLEQGDKKSEAVLWYDAQGRLCAIQFNTDLGIVDYVRTKVR